MHTADRFLGLYFPQDFHSACRNAGHYNSLLGHDVRILSFYTAWDAGRDGPDLAGIEEVLRSGRIPLITWEPWRRPEFPPVSPPENQPEFSLGAVLNGKYDDYIWKWALALRNVSGPVFFRPMHEMNGNWYPWCGTVNGNKPGDYIEVWRYFRSIFRKAGSHRVIWVWSPYAHSVPDDRQNEMENYYPGSSEVDWLALDGYNWGATREWSRWQSFQEIFEKPLHRMHQLAPGKPAMIAEMGCAEEGGNKSRWVEEAFRYMETKCPPLQALVWFNVRKECDWRIESSPESLISFRQNWSRLMKEEIPNGCR